MPNPEQYALIKRCAEQGNIAAWNQWRKKNPDISVDLNGADLIEAELIGAEIVGDRTKIIGADLSGANLRGAKLIEADLSGADLSRAYLRGAYLSGADLIGANLSGADLSRANLRGAYLSGADLSFANLSRADLSFANLIDANLSVANFSGADLREADLSGADLSGADLRGANLIKANLSEANLSGADLSGANLNEADLVRSNLSDAILTGAKLYGTARDDWIIKGIKCDYVYWDAEGEQKSPPDRILEPGEFEAIYSQLPTIEYIFKNGMTPLDPLIMDRVVQAIRDKNPEFDIKIDSINARGLAPSIKFTVQHEEQKDTALVEMRKIYETKIQSLKAERGLLYELVKGAIDRPSEIKLIKAKHYSEGDMNMTEKDDHSTNVDITDSDVTNTAIGSGASANAGDITTIKDSIVNSTVLDADAKGKFNKALEALEKLALSPTKQSLITENIGSLQNELEKSEDNRDAGTVKKLLAEVNVIATPVAAILSTIAAIATLIG